MTGPVLVMGGTGFVGRAIVQALAGTAFPPIVAARHDRPAQADMQVRICDASRPESLAAAMRGVRYAVNAVLADPATMRLATRLICEAAAKSGVGRIVHISSMAVYGEAHGLVAEDAPLAASRNPYALGKQACEEEISRYTASGGSAIILRPGIVYGPGGEQWIGRICRMLRAKRLGDLGPAGDGWCNLCHAADLGQAVLASLRAPALADGVFNVSTPDPPRWNTLFATLALAIRAVPVLRIGARRLAFESRVLAPPLQLAKLALAKTGWSAGTLPEPIPPSLLALFGQHIRLDSARADTLGFARTPDAAGLAESAGWFLAEEKRRG